MDYPTSIDDKQNWVASKLAYCFASKTETLVEINTELRYILGIARYWGIDVRKYLEIKDAKDQTEKSEFVCRFCNKEFLTTYGLKAHVGKMHKKS
jgi:hypothetical protein